MCSWGVTSPSYLSMKRCLCISGVLCLLLSVHEELFMCRWGVTSPSYLSIKSCLCISEVLCLTLSIKSCLCVSEVLCLLSICPSYRRVLYV